MIADDRIRIEVGRLAGCIRIDPLLEALVKICVAAFGVEGICHHTVRIVSGILDQDIAVPGITGDPLHGQTEISCLIQQERCIQVIGGSEDSLHTAVLDIGQNGLEIRLVGLEGLSILDCPAECRERICKGLHKTAGIFVADVVDGGDLLIPVVICPVRHNLALERIKIAGAEIIIIAQRDICVGAGCADCRDFRIREIRACGDADTGAVSADHTDHAV